MTRRERARRTVEALRRTIPRPETELRHEDPYQLIVAVILSAQCTDERVNIVTPALFERFPTLERLSEAEPEDIYPYIKSVTYPNSKSRHLARMARTITRDFDGRVPETLDDLLKLPGVGRKTAQVVASVAFDVDALPVDTHIFRVANRIGLVENARTPLHVERQLKNVLKEEDWSEGHHLLILHGRYTCTSRNPKCEICPVPPACRYYDRLQRLPDPLKGLSPRKGRYYCRTRDHYFDAPAWQTDRYGIQQITCPRCGSMNVFDSKTGRSTKQIPDYRVG